MDDPIAVTPSELKNLLYPQTTDECLANVEADGVATWDRGSLFNWLKQQNFRRGCGDWREYSRAKWALNNRYGWIQTPGLYNRLIGWICDYLKV